MKCLMNLIVVGMVTFLLPLSDAIAAKQKANRSQSSEAHANCVYNYTSCHDNCEYYQDKSQIGPCKAKCDRSYGCRPSKMERPVDKTPNEPY